MDSSVEAGKPVPGAVTKVEKMPVPGSILSIVAMWFGATSVPAQYLAPVPEFILAQHQSQAAAEQELTPEERMRRRFPQWVRVADLIGLRVLDYDDVTIGIVRHVARTSEGKIRLIVAHSGPLGWGGRLVSVPIEAVAIFGRQLASLDMAPAEYASAATWTSAGAKLLGEEDKILIGLTKR